MTLVQSAEHGKTGAARGGRGKGNPGVWYGALVCILAHEREPVGGRCALLFGIQAALGTRPEPGCQLIPSVEIGALGCGEPDG